MSLDEILLGAVRAKAPSRQVGQMFRRWLHRLGCPVLPKTDFLKNKRIAILEGGDAALMNFAREKLGYRGQKGLDMILKVKNKFIIGEAKFITTSGGTQDKSFRESMSFIQQKDKKTIRVAILDGVVWLVSKKAKLKKKKPSLYETITSLSSDKIALSALLLEDLIKKLQRSKN